MSAPVDRPLSLARLRALPVGAVIVDRNGNRHVRERTRKGTPGWFRDKSTGLVAPPDYLHHVSGPLRLASAAEVAP